MKFKKSLLVLSSAVAILAFSGSAFANNQSLNQLSPNPPRTIAISPGTITPYGEDAPGSSASTHDLSISDYNYQVFEVGYKIFTDKFLKGSATINVSIENFTKIQGSLEATKTVRVTLYGASGTIAGTRDVAINDGGGYGDCSFAVYPQNKYYISFQPANDGNKYSFNGSISG